MNVAVIGAGHWGKNLVKNFHELGVLSAVAESSPALQAEIERQYPGLSLYDDYRPILKGPIEAVAIATSAPTHFEIAAEALKAGKDVFVEKPLTLNSAEAEGLQALSESTGRILMVGHLLMYQRAVDYLKGALLSGTIGKLVSLHQERLNLGRARSVENVLWSFGVHDLAVLLYLVGSEPERLRAVGQCALQPTVEDDVHLHLAFKEGVQAHLHVSWLWPEKRRRLSIVGSEAMLVYDEEAQTVTRHQKGIAPDLSNRDQGSEIVYQGDGEPLKRELTHFIDCVNERRAPLSDGRSGLAVVRVLEMVSEQLGAGAHQMTGRPSTLANCATRSP